MIFLKKYWFVILIFALGFFLRAVAADRYPLLFDQVQILENAEKIRSGNLTLIGPRTGPAEMFTGPLIYYLAAGTMIFIQGPYAVVVMSLGIYVFTFASLWWVLERYRGLVSPKIYLSLFTLSPFLVILDRIPWNPNLSFLSGLLTFFPLSRLSKQEKFRSLDAFILGVGVYLGFQAHFSGLLLPIIALISWAIWSRKVLPFLAIMCGLFFTLLPTVVFDLKNDWLNLRGLLAMVARKDKVSLELTAFLFRFMKDLGTNLSLLGRVILYESSILQQMLIGTFVVSGFVGLVRRSHERLWFPLFWCLLFIAAFVFYKGDKPEYYFVMLFPALLFILAKVIERLLITERAIVLGFFGFFLFSLTTVTMDIQARSGMVIGDELAAVAFVRTYLKTEGKHALVFDVPRDQDVGLKYLLPKDMLEQKNELRKIHFVFPLRDIDPVTKQFGKLGVWVDLRSNPELLYVQKDKLTLITPKSMRLLQNLYPSQEFNVAETKFETYLTGKFIGSLYVFDDQVQKNFSLQAMIESVKPPFSKTDLKWQLVEIAGKSVYMKKIPSKYLVFEFDSEVAKDTRETLVNMISDFSL